MDNKTQQLEKTLADTEIEKTKILRKTEQLEKNIAEVEIEKKNILVSVERKEHDLELKKKELEFNFEKKIW